MNTTSLFGSEILVVFLRKNYQYKLSSHANESNLLLRP
jgi:hypothetical protein